MLSNANSKIDDDMLNKRRESSSKYRMKKREQEKEMKEELCNLRSENTVLKYVNEQYKKENCRLRKQLADHMNSCLGTMVKSTTVAIPGGTTRVVTEYPLDFDCNSNYMMDENSTVCTSPLSDDGYLSMEVEDWKPFAVG